MDIFSSFAAHNKYLQVKAENKELKMKTYCKAENKELKMKTYCNECGVNEATTAFLPCGHFFTCEDCAKTQKRCKLCGAIIKGTIKAYRS